MGWKNKALNLLKEKFGSDSFYAAEAVELLEREVNYKPGTIYRLLKEFADSDMLIKVGYGIYTARAAREGWFLSPSLPSNMEKARDLLLERDVEFMITGPSVLVPYMHLLPRRLIHLIYTIKGAGEYLVELLGAEFPGLVNPTEAAVNVALHFTEKDLVVVREFSTLSGGEEGVASLERALVDLYFETTRHRIPFPVDETGRILFSALSNAKIDIAKLNHLAMRRGIDGEWRAIIKAAGIKVPAKIAAKNVLRNRHVEAILGSLGRGI
ncbi:MAG: DUF6577 family protein [Candidatus Heimdallarchaeota archaeon]